MLRIRAGRLEDVPGIIALERGIAEAPHWSEQEYAAMVVGGSGGALRRCLLVAETDSLKLIGLAAAKVIEAAGETVGELESVAVASEARRQGVGRALCEAVLGWCREEGALSVELEVRSKNGTAIALYERMGFVEVGRRKAYYRDPLDDALLMKLQGG